MYLNVISSDSCALHHIRMSNKLRKSLDLDLGDWLIFNTTIGFFSVMVVRSTLEDLFGCGENKAHVSADSPVLFSENAEVFIERHQLTIGADPEFFILGQDNRLVEAYKLLPHEGRLGSDGDLAELRPEYALCPEQLTENIRRIIATIPRRLPAYLHPAASSFYANRCCGFHIHLGMPVELLSFAADQTDRFFKNIVSTLDYLIGIPAAALDNSDKRRLSYEYGRPGDYRLNMRTLEYRTPGGYHLRSPEYTKSLLSIAFSVMDKIVKEAEEISGGWVDMEEVVKFDYFCSKYNIPSKTSIKEILTSKNRDVLEKANEHVLQTLPKIMDEYAYNLITTRPQTQKPLINEWLKDAT